MMTIVTAKTREIDARLEAAIKFDEELQSLEHLPVFDDDLRLSRIEYSKFPDDPFSVTAAVTATPYMVVVEYKYKARLFYKPWRDIFTAAQYTDLLTIAKAETTLTGVYQRVAMRRASSDWAEIRMSEPDPETIEIDGCPVETSHIYYHDRQRDIIKFRLPPETHATSEQVQLLHEAVNEIFNAPSA